MYIRKPDFIVRHSKVGDRRGFKWKIVGYPTPGVRKIFWFAFQKDAVREAETLNIQLHKYGEAAASLSIHQRSDAFRALSLLGGEATLTECACFYVESKRLNLPSKLLSDIVDECIDLAERRSKREELSIAQVSALKKGSVRLLKEFGSRDASTITRQELMRWLDNIPVSSTSQDFFRRYAVTFFNFALERQYITSNPCKGIRKTGGEGDIEILTVDQCRSLMQASPAHMVPYYSLALFAGLRPESEIQRLEWSAIDWIDRLIRVGNWKTGRKKRSARFRDVMISDNLLEWLSPYREWTGRVWPLGWYTSHRDTRKTAGILHWPRDALRHTYGSYLLAIRGDAGHVASQMGHESTSMVYKHYRRLVKPIEAEAFWNIYPQDALPAAQ